MRTSQVLVVIINYKTATLIPGLLNSIREDDLPVSILILDNENSHSSRAILGGIKDERIQIITAGTNLGFTGGVNYAVNYATKDKLFFDYFFLINPDAICPPNLISFLIGVMNKDEKIAAVSPKILDSKGDIWYIGGKFDYAKGRVLQTRDIGIQEEREVDVFNGCAVLFNTTIFSNAGMLEEKLFMYYEEAELSMRFKKVGYKIFYTPSKEVIHNISYSTKNSSYVKTYFMTRNKFFVFNDTMTFLNKMIFILHECAFHLKNFRLKNVYYHLLGVIHFLMKKTGKVILR